MAERKATNKYYPPEWDPSKGSINTFRGSHPLRERARKLDQGILIIRFELPFNIWCDGCNNHVGMGVRYNAQKSKVDMYYTTPVYQFRMKCHLCDNHFVIKSDPQNLDYIVVSGARRQERRWDSKENEQIEVDKSIKKKLSLDPMFKLEHSVLDKDKALANKSAIEQLEQIQDRWKDDYSSNGDLRRRFRTQKKQLKEIATEDCTLLHKYSLPTNLQLVTENERDVRMAKMLTAQSKHTPEQMMQIQRRKILNQSIFSHSKQNSLFQKRKRSPTRVVSSSQLKSQRPKLKLPTSLKSSCTSSIVNYSSDSE